ncbi:hypothetical protein Tco_0470933 [Tanacetum coccineum]
MYHNLNQLQWQLERDNFHGHVSKTCLVVLRIKFKEFFYSKEVNAPDVPNKCWQKSFSDGVEWEPEAYKCLLLRYLEELDKFIDERALKYGELRIKESETLEACLVNEGLELNDNTGVTESSGTESENSNSETSFSRPGDENISSDKESSSSEGNDAAADIGPSYDSDTVIESPHSSNDTFENMFAHGRQSHEQPKFFPDTYEVNKNNSNIISDIPNMDPDKDKEEHDDVDYEQQRAFFASLINNLKCDVEKCNEINREAQQANDLLTNELERYLEKEKHFAKDMTIEYEYCKKIKLLNDKISYLKYQACEKDKTFTKDNEKYVEYVQPLLKRKNELENKNQEFLKQINDLDNRL